MILIGSLSLMALPFMTGYYSKDLIIESSYGAYNLSSYIIYYITLISAMFTSLYSLKLIYLTFLSKPNSSYEKYLHIHEPSLNMGIPLIILAIFSIFFGYLFKDLIIGLGSPYLGNSIFILPKNSIMIQTEFSLPSIFKLLPLIFTLLMIIISITVYEFMPLNIFKINSKLFIEKYKFFNQRFYFEFLLEKYIINKGLYLGYISNKDLDRGILEKIGPYGSSQLITWCNNNLSKIFNTGLVTNYALYIFIGLTLSLMSYLLGSIELFLIYIIALFFI